MLGKVGRRINDQTAEYPLVQINRWLGKNFDSPVPVDIVVLGLAFKGEPETNDLRESCGVALVRQLQQSGHKVKAWDAVIDSEHLKSNDLDPVSDISRSLGNADVVCIMNNHPQHVRL